MTPNASSANPHVNEEQQKYEDKAHLECPREVQARIESETRAINKQLGIPERKARGSGNKLRGLSEFETEILWTNTIALLLLHAVCVYYLVTFPWSTKWHVFVWGEYEFYRLIKAFLVAVTMRF